MKRYTWSVGVVLFAITTSLAAADKFTLRVNAGADKELTDKAGNVWKPDKQYVKGQSYGFVAGQTIDRGTNLKIEATEDARIYQTEHYSMEAFKAEVPEGKFTVRLHFAETYEGITADGERVFTVKIQGKEVLKDFDVRKTAGTSQKAVVKEFKEIEAKDGIIDIGFDVKTQNPEINGIEIIAE
jgi:hypothetical protein